MTFEEIKLKQIIEENFKKLDQNLIKKFKSLEKQQKNLRKFCESIEHIERKMTEPVDESQKTNLGNI